MTDTSISVESCEGKIAYANPARAHTAAKYHASKRRSAQPYRCQHCGQWHIGQPDGRRRAQLREGRS